MPCILFRMMDHSLKKKKTKQNSNYNNTCTENRFLQYGLVLGFPGEEHWTIDPRWVARTKYDFTKVQLGKTAIFFLLMVVCPPRISIAQISSPCDTLCRSFNPNLFTLLSLITTSLPLWLQSSNSTIWGDPFLFTRILLIPANCWKQCDQTVWGKDTVIISFRIKLHSWAQWNYPIVLISQKK